MDGYRATKKNESPNPPGLKLDGEKDVDLLLSWNKAWPKMNHLEDGGNEEHSVGRVNDLVIVLQNLSLRENTGFNLESKKVAEFR